MKRLGLFSLLLTLLACSKDEVTPPPPVMEATIGGKAWKAVTATSGVLKEDPAMFFVGVGEDGSIIHIYLNPGGVVGSTPLNGMGSGTIPDSFIRYTSGTDVYESALSPEIAVGEVAIITLTNTVATTNGTMSGKFSADLTKLGPGDPVTKITGTFTNIPFKPGSIDFVAPGVPIELAYAKVNGTKRPFSVEASSATGGVETVIYSNSDISITLSFPLTTTGLQTFGTAPYFASIKINGATTTASSGQLGVELNNQTTGRIEGFFSFTTSSSTVTEGVFAVTK